MFYTVCFYCMLSSGSSKPSKYIETKLFPHINFFKKQKGLELVSLPYFLHDFLRKIFLLLYSIIWTKFHCMIAFTL